MSFSDCINAALEVGKIKKGEANKILSTYESHYKAYKESGIGDAAASNSAALAALNVTAKTSKAERWAKLNEIQRIHDINKNFRDSKVDPGIMAKAHMVYDPRAPVKNVSTSHERYLDQFHTKLSNVIQQFKPKLGGLIHPVKNMDNVLGELFGKGTGDASAKELAESILQTNEFIRKTLNSLGASIEKNARFRLPQKHSAYKIRRRGKETWIKDHLEEDVLDWAAMTHPDGKPILNEERGKVLDYVVDTLISKGDIRLKPGVAYTKNLAASLSDQRFLVYKDEKAWKNMAAKYGEGNAIQQIFGYVDDMAKKAALMDVFGPSPSSTRAMIEKLARNKGGGLDVASAARGPDKKKGKTDKTRGSIETFNEMFDIFSATKVSDNENLAGQVLAAGRNMIVSSKLGSSVIKAIPSDLFKAAHVAFFNKTSPMRLLSEYRKLLPIIGNKEYRKWAARSAFAAAEARNISAGAKRMVYSLSGPDWSRRLANATIELSGLGPHTEALKRASMLELLGTLTEYRNLELGRVPAKELMERHGISSKEWDIFRSTEIPKDRPADTLLPEDIRQRTDIDNTEAQRVADLFHDFAHSIRQRAVIEGNLEVFAHTVGASSKGTVKGEVLRSFAMLKSFTFTLAMMEMRNLAALKTTGSRITQSVSLLAGLTISGMVGLQLSQIASGRDPLDVQDPRTWGAAAVAGGGTPIIGDFFFANINRYGSGFGEIISGPAAGLANDTINLTLGNALQYMQGEDTNFSSELVRFTGRHTPILSSLWPTKLLFQRFLDQIAITLDPKAERKFRQIEDRSLENYNQGHWWAPGQAAPERAPDIGSLFGGAEE